MKRWLITVVLTFAAAVVSESNNRTFSILRDCLLSEWTATTSGRIVKSEMDLIGRWGSVAYDICYSYEVDGVAYKGCRIRCDARTEDVVGTLKEYPVGAKVDVFFDPSAPGYSNKAAGSVLTFQHLRRSGAAPNPSQADDSPRIIAPFALLPWPGVSRAFPGS